jgi:plasmid stability protein
MSHLTLRRIPEPVERELRTLAAQTGVSLNKTAISVLRKGLGLEPMEQRKRDLSHLAGRWTPGQADEFDRRMEIFEQIDEELWQ